MIYCSFCAQLLDCNDEWDVKYAWCESCHNGEMQKALENRAREDQEGYDHWLEIEKKRLQTEGCTEND
jgi:hypothetical protein